MTNDIEKMAKQLAAEQLRETACELTAKANKLEMGEAWSSNPDNVKPKLEVIK